MIYRLKLVASRAESLKALEVSINAPSMQALCQFLYIRKPDAFVQGIQLPS